MTSPQLHVSTETEYVLLPLGRRIMIGLLIVVFIAIFVTGQYWIYPINAFLGLFTEFRVGTGFFVRGAGAILFSIVIIAGLLELVFERISWYKFEFDGDNDLILHYRSSITDSFQEYKFSLRYTKIQYLDGLLWLVTIIDDEKMSILITPPNEKPEVPFFSKLDEQIDEYYFKVKKQLSGIGLDDFDQHYLFIDGDIKKFTAQQFTLLTGISRIYPEPVESVKEEQDDDDDEEAGSLIQIQVDDAEFDQIMNDAPKVKSLQ